MSFLFINSSPKKSTDLVSEIENFTKQVLKEKSYISFPKKLIMIFLLSCKIKLKCRLKENKKKLRQLNKKSSQYLQQNNITIDYLLKRPKIFNFFDSMMLDEMFGYKKIILELKIELHQVRFSHQLENI